MHLADAFIQYRIAFKVYSLSVHAFFGHQTHYIGVASARDGRYTGGHN